MRHEEQNSQHDKSHIILVRMFVCCCIWNHDQYLNVNKNINLLFGSIKWLIDCLGLGIILITLLLHPSILWDFIVMKLWNYVMYQGKDMVSRCCYNYWTLYKQAAVGFIVRNTCISQIYQISMPTSYLIKPTLGMLDCWYLFECICHGDSK